MINRLVELVLVEVIFSGGRLGTKHEKKMKNAIKIVVFSKKSRFLFFYFTSFKFLNSPSTFKVIEYTTNRPQQSVAGL